MEGEGVKLLGAWPSPFSFRVEWALKLKGVQYEFIREHLSNKSSMLLHYNPIYKKIPVLVHAGRPIAESAFIIEYIDETWPHIHPLLPQDAYERARARFWAKFGDEKCIAIWDFFRSTGQEQEKAKEVALEALRILEEQGLGEKKFFGGDSIGFADIILGWIAHMLGMVEEIVGIKLVEAHSFPGLHAWMKNFVEDPVIKANLTPHDEVLAYYRQWRENYLASSHPSH